MELKYKKQCDLDVMMDILKLNPLWDDFKRVNMTEYDGTKDNIVIELNRHFYSQEVDQITALIESYSNNHPLQVRKTLEENVSAPGMIIGQGLIAKYAAMNLYAQKSALQIIEILGLTANLTNYLFTGSLEMALYEMTQLKANLPQSGSITEAECDEFIRRLQVEIKLLKG